MVASPLTDTAPVPVLKVPVPVWAKFPVNVLLPVTLWTVVKSTQFWVLDPVPPLAIPKMAVPANVPLLVTVPVNVGEASGA